MMRRVIAPLALLLTMGALVAVETGAQDLCEAIVRQALDNAAENCEGAGVNSACYGFGGLDSDFFIEEIGDVFNEPGSLVEAPVVQRVQTNGLDIDEEDWGIAYFRVVMEGTTEEEPAVLIMMGDVEVENAVEFNEDLREAFESGETIPLSELYFSTGEQSDCALAPNRLLVQSPAGRTVLMNINEVPVSISSTASFGITKVGDSDEDVMYIHTVDGAVRITPEGERPLVIPAGTTRYAPVSEPDPETGRRVVTEDVEFTEPLTMVEAEELDIFDDEYFATEELLPEDLLNYSLEEESLDALYEELIEEGYCFGFDAVAEDGGYEDGYFVDGDCAALIDYGEPVFYYDEDGTVFYYDENVYYDEDGNFVGYGDEVYDAEGEFEGYYEGEGTYYEDGAVYYEGDGDGTIYYEGGEGTYYEGADPYSNPYAADDGYDYSEGYGYEENPPDYDNGGYDGSAYSNPYYTDEGGEDYSGSAYSDPYAEATADPYYQPPAEYVPPADDPYNTPPEYVPPADVPPTADPYYQPPSDDPNGGGYYYEPVECPPEVDPAECYSTTY